MRVPNSLTDYPRDPCTRVKLDEILEKARNSRSAGEEAFWLDRFLECMPDGYEHYVRSGMSLGVYRGEKIGWSLRPT